MGYQVLERLCRLHSLFGVLKAFVRSLTNPIRGAYTTTATSEETRMKLVHFFAGSSINSADSFDISQNGLFLFSTVEPNLRMEIS
jgi:hypothetical protein